MERLLGSSFIILDLFRITNEVQIEATRIYYSCSIMKKINKLNFRVVACGSYLCGETTGNLSSLTCVCVRYLSGLAHACIIVSDYTTFFRL